MLHREVLLSEGISPMQADRIIAKSQFGTYVTRPGGGMSLDPVPGGWGGDGPAAAPTAQGGNCGTDIEGGIGEPWSIITLISLAAGALSGTADLGEVFDASESFMIADDNKVPDDFYCTGIQAYLGVASVVDGGAEHIGELSGFFLREVDGSGDGQEQGIWPLAQLGSTVGYFGGFGTSTGGVGMVEKLNATPIDWVREYSTQGTFSLALRHTTGFTSLNDIIVGVVLSGRRFTKKRFK